MEESNSVKSAKEAKEAPLLFEIERADQYSEYLIDSKTAILGICRSLIRTGSAVRVYPGQKKTFMNTTMLALSADSKYFIIDVDRDKEINRRLQSSRKMIVSAYDKNVNVQFMLSKLWLSTHEGYPAFFGAVPDLVLRLQRREFHRVYPVDDGLKLRTSLKDSDGNLRPHDMRLFDISIGGVGLIANGEQASFLEHNPVLRDCEVNLPGEGDLCATVNVRNVFHITTRSGAHRVRVGCQFEGLSRAQTEMVERFVVRMDRERLARERGLA